MDACGSFPLDVCEDMKKEMFLELLPQVCPWSPQGNGWEEPLLRSFCDKEEVAVIEPPFTLGLA